MNPIYMDDSYAKEFDARVVDVEGGGVILDNTAFFPQGGGVPCDTGFIEKDGQRFRVASVTKSDGNILHHIDGELHKGDAVRGVIDWDRRYLLMCNHTAAHLLAAIMFNDLGVLITGNQLDVDKSRMDFSLDNFDRAIMEKVFEKANEEIARDRKVRSYYMKREEALKLPGIIKLAAAQGGAAHFPPVAELRIVEIDGIDMQLDGGCHVRSLGEIGRVDFLKAENKGKSNRRIYYAVKPLDRA